MARRQRRHQVRAITLILTLPLPLPLTPSPPPHRCEGTAELKKEMLEAVVGAVFLARARDAGLDRGLEDGRLPSNPSPNPNPNPKPDPYPNPNPNP